MNGYIAFYNGKRWECHATTLYQAYEAAVNYFKPPQNKRRLVTVVLAEKNGEAVTVTLD